MLETRSETASKTMTVKLVAFGIARDLLQGSETELQVSQNSTLGVLRERLLHDYPGFSALASLRFAVNEEYQEDHFALRPGDEVVIIPPVSGG